MAVYPYTGGEQIHFKIRSGVVPNRAIFEYSHSLFGGSIRIELL